MLTSRSSLTGRSIGLVIVDPWDLVDTDGQNRVSGAQVAITPQTGVIVTAFPTGSRLRRQLLRRAGGSP